MYFTLADAQKSPKQRQFSSSGSSSTFAILFIWTISFYIMQSCVYSLITAGPWCSRGSSRTPLCSEEKPRPRSQPTHTDVQIRNRHAKNGPTSNCPFLILGPSIHLCIISNFTWSYILKVSTVQFLPQVEFTRRIFPRRKIMWPNAGGHRHSFQLSGAHQGLTEA